MGDEEGERMAVKFFETVTTYGEQSGVGYYWRTAETDWVGPFADPAEALADGELVGK